VGDLADALKPVEARILSLDLERLPGEVTLDVWEPRDFRRVNYVHPERWSIYPRTLCASGQWYGQKGTLFVAAWEQPDDPWHVARTVWQWLDEADLAVGFNHKAADLKWLRTDWLQAGLPMPSPWRDVDLYLIARQAFAFESKSLQHLCTRLDLPVKAGKYNATEAKAALLDDGPERRRLVRYSRQDARLNFAVFDRLKPYLTGYNLGLYAEDEARVCVNCGGRNLQPAGWANTATRRFPSYRCSDCQTLMRGKHRSAAVPMRGITR